MARRTTGPRYFASKGGFFCNLNGERVCLAKGPEKDPSVRAQAHQKYHELMLSSPTAGDGATVVAILDAFLVDLEPRAKRSTFDLWRRMYQSFAKHIKGLLVRDLKPYIVSDWLAEMSKPRTNPRNGLTKGWGQSTKRIAVTALKAAFAWAVDQDRISKNPIARLKAPPGRARGADELLSEDDYQRMLGSCRRAMRDLLTALNDTGARPGEVIRVEAQHYHPDIAAWVLDIHKTDKTGKKRVIYLTEGMVEMTERLIKLRPTGPIFRNSYGRPWTLYAMDSQFRRFRENLGLKKVTPYSLRHKFATEFLLAGGSMAYVAQLQGNTVAMVEKHYGHLREHGQELRSKLLEFRSSGTEARALALDPGHSCAAECTP